MPNFLFDCFLKMRNKGLPMTTFIPSKTLLTPLPYCALLHLGIIYFVIAFEATIDCPLPSFCLPSTCIPHIFGYIIWILSVNWKQITEKNKTKSVETINLYIKRMAMLTINNSHSCRCCCFFPVFTRFHLRLWPRRPPTPRDSRMKDCL